MLLQRWRAHVNMKTKPWTMKLMVCDSCYRLTSVINPPVDVITSCVNCLIALAARQPAKVNVHSLVSQGYMKWWSRTKQPFLLLIQVWSSLHHTGFLPFASTPLSNMAQAIRWYTCRASEQDLLKSEKPEECHVWCVCVCSVQGMKAGNYGNLLVLIEQPRGEYSVTIAFLRLVTTLVKVIHYHPLWPIMWKWPSF